MWKTASRMVRKGVHMFRESLHEGVKVAQMLKEDVDEGVALLTTNNKKSATLLGSEESASSSEESIKKANDDLEVGITLFMDQVSQSN